jgi:riboflavin synthase
LFTGIIEEIGTVKTITRGAKSVCVTIGANKIFGDLKIGDSIAVNGVCLTVTDINGEFFSADIMYETLSRSSMTGLKSGNRVNLERAMPVTGRFGGHIVSGHIDGTGTVSLIKKEDIALRYTIAAPPRIMRYIVEKGSVAIDGISLTVAEIQKDRFCVSVIPHTANETVLHERAVGSSVNIENDIIGKYIEKFVAAPQGITKQFLQENGF